MPLARLTAFYLRLCDFIYSSTIFLNSETELNHTLTHLPRSLNDVPWLLTPSHTSRKAHSILFTALLFYFWLCNFFKQWDWAQSHSYTSPQPTKWWPMATHTLTHIQRDSQQFIWGSVILFTALWFFKSWADAFFYSERHKKNAGTRIFHYSPLLYA